MTPTGTVLAVLAALALSTVAYAAFRRRRVRRILDAAEAGTRALDVAYADAVADHGIARHRIAARVEATGHDPDRAARTIAEGDAWAQRWTIEAARHRLIGAYPELTERLATPEERRRAGLTSARRNPDRL